ncbi:MAG: hypothetical protein JNK35_11945 [Phycisphaerae bacterium]|nr:hypothetical protein [Phycisphaerae bacterium]
MNSASRNASTLLGLAAFISAFGGSAALAVCYTLKTKNCIDLAPPPLAHPPCSNCFDAHYAGGQVNDHLANLPPGGFGNTSRVPGLTCTFTIQQRTCMGGVCVNFLNPYEHSPRGLIPGGGSYCETEDSSGGGGGSPD